MAGYLVSLIIFSGVYALFGLGLNLQWGFTGLINFGHVAFMTIGAYTTVLLSSLGVPIIIAVLLGAAIAALLGLLIGASTLRLREDYLAIVTIGVSELIRLLALNEEWLTRGAFGVQSYPLPLGNFQPNLVGKLILLAILTFLAIFAQWQLWRGLRKRWHQAQQIKDKNPQRKQLIEIFIWALLATAIIVIIFISGVIAISNYTYKAGLMVLVLLATALVYWGLEFLVHSPWGRILKAIREDEEIAKALGKNVFWYKLQSFMLGGAIAGIAGAFYAWQLATVYPTNFEPIVTFYAWTIVVLGGAGNNIGTILAALIFFLYNEGTRYLLPQLGFLNSSQAGALRVMIIGLILMVLMVWRPQGILGKKEELTLER